MDTHCALRFSESAFDDLVRAVTATTSASNRSIGQKTTSITIGILDGDTADGATLCDIVPNDIHTFPPS